MNEIRAYLNRRIEVLSKILENNGSSDEESALALGRLAIITDMYSQTIEFNDKKIFMEQMKVKLRHNINIVNKEYTRLPGKEKRRFSSSLRFKWLNGKVCEIIELLVHFNVNHRSISSAHTWRFFNWRSIFI